MPTDIVPNPTRRQPEIGSAVGMTTDQTIARIDRRMDYLAGLRDDYVTLLARAIDNNHTDTPLTDSLSELNRATIRLVTRWR